MLRPLYVAVALLATAPLPTFAAELEGGLPEPYNAPELAGIEHWINTSPLTMESLRGKVVLVDFWAYSCVNCVRTLPYLTAWDHKYRDKGLVILGIHAPEFDFEKSPENVKRAANKWHVSYPVALDNQLATWAAFHNRYWPAHYLINKEGQVVYTHFGEGNYDITEANIRALLDLPKNEQDSAADAVQDDTQQTPETYLGYRRAGRYVGDAPAHDAPQPFTAAESLPLHRWTLGGNWEVGAEHITSTTAGAMLTLHFQAQNVYLVLGAADGKPKTLTLTLDGKPLPAVTVKDHTLYTLVKQEKSASHTLSLTAQEAGLEAYAFTFGK